MKLIIAGSRNFNEKKLMSLFDINSLLEMFNLEWPEEFIHGGCPTGADKYCDIVADSYHDTTKLKVFYADWNKNGKAAGPIRNEQMAKYGDCLILIWDGISRGSLNMKNNMVKENKPVYEVIIKGQ